MAGDVMDIGLSEEDSQLLGEILFYRIRALRGDGGESGGSAGVH